MPLDFDKMFGEAAGEKGGDEEGEAEAKAMAGIMKTMMGDVLRQSTDTGETKNIGSWNCRKSTLVIDMGGMGKTEAKRGRPRSSRSTTPWPTPWPTA